MPEFDVVLQVPFEVKLRVRADTPEQAGSEAALEFHAAPKQFNTEDLAYAGDPIVEADVKAVDDNGHYLWLNRSADGSWRAAS